MQFILTCNNGKEIDMTHYVGKQMDGEITRQDVLTKIKQFQDDNL